MLRAVGLACMLALTVVQCDKDVPDDAKLPESNMNISELIRHWGYTAEEHDVETEDGYILSVNRIPHGLNDPSQGPRPAVLLLHGLLAAGSDWVINLPGNSLGFLLADSGYDVWLGNSRGNTWSRRHKTLKDTDEEFWDFSFDELALKDLPAVVDYIRSTTGQEQIFYVGYSQGTTIGFIAFSRLPKLAKKIKMFLALAPVAFMKYPPNVYSLARLFSDNFLYHIFGHKDFFPQSAAIECLANTPCPHHKNICTNFFVLIIGFDEGKHNKTRLPIYLAHYPAGTSTRNMIHWKQFEKNGDLKAFDYGLLQNLKIYHRFSPPVYNVKDMKVPTAMWSGGKDILADPRDVDKLLPKVSNLVFYRQIKHWNHQDFIWGLDAPQELYNELIQLMEQHR